MARTFDPSLIYDTIQSFWREYYVDRSRLERLWEAMVRVMDDEWAQGEQVNDSSQVATCPTFIYHTYLYRKLEEWHSYGIPHRHFRKDWRATAGQTIFYTGGWPDPATTQVFLNGKETDELLDPYVVTLEQDATQPGINPTGARLIFDNPVALNIAVSLFADREWVHYEFEVPAGGAPAYSFGARVDPASLKITIKKYNLTSQLALTATSFAWATLPSATSAPDTRTFLRGEEFEVVDAGVTQSIALVSDSPTVTIPVPVNPVTAKVYKTFNLEVTKGKVGFHSKGLAASDQVFPPNCILRASDCSGSLGKFVSTPSRIVEFEREFEPETRHAWLLGGEISGRYETTDQAVTFERSFLPGTVLLVEAALWVENDHAEYHETLAAVANQVSVPVTRPFALDPLLVELPDMPVQFFVNGHLQARDTYFFPSTTTIQLNVGIMPVGTKVDIYYVDLEDPVPHRHVREAIRVLSPTGAFELDDYVAGRFSRYVSAGGVEVGDDAQRQFRQDGHYLYFITPLPAGTLVRVRGARRSYRYWHEIDAEFVRAEYLQNGIDQQSSVIPGGWTVQLAWDVGFTITSGIVESDEAIEDAWFVNAYVDERTAYKNFGALIGLDRATSDDYVRVLRALVPGSYMASTAQVLESLSCVILGSDYLVSPGKVDSIEQSTVRVGSSTYALDLLVPSRISAGQVYGRLHAVSQYVRVLDEWTPFDALPLMVGQYSDDFSFARNLDIHRDAVLDGGISIFDRNVLKLIDNNVDFVDEEVWPGDLVALYPLLAPTIPRFGRVTEVDRHWVKILPDPGWLTIAWGEQAWGGGVTQPSAWGGSVEILDIDHYRIWVRNTDTMDRWRHLDEALPEDIPYLSERLHNLLSPFVFLVEFRWAGIKSAQALTDVIWFLDRAKPADTSYIPYTKVEEGTLLEEVVGTVGDSDPVITEEPNFAIPCSDDSILAIVGINGQISPNVGSFIGV